MFANLKLLFLSNNEIGDVGFRHLSSALVSPIQDGVAQRLGEGWPQHWLPLSKLEALDLYGNKVGTLGVGFLTDACERGALPILQKLHLDMLRGYGGEVHADVQNRMKEVLRSTSGAQVFFG